MDQLPARKILDSRIRCFVESDGPGALLLYGEWGTGKTYAVRKTLNGNGTESQIPFSYISLYGISTVQEIYTRIVFESITSRSIKSLNQGKDLDNSKIGKKIKGIAHEHGVRLLSAFFKKEKVESVGIAAFDILASNSIIVIDDFERKDDRLSIESVLGVVNYLSDARECKVIVIANEAKIRDDKQRLILDEQKEKAFDFELQYTPTVKENVEIFGKAFMEFLLPPFARLGVSNLRAIKRTAKALSAILQHTPSDCPNALNTLLNCAAKLGVLHYEFRSKIKLPPENGASDIRVSQILDRENHETSDTDDLILRSEYEKSAFDVYALEILKYGTTEWEPLQDELRRFEMDFEAESANKRVSSMLRSIFENYKITTEDAVSTLKSECVRNVLNLNPGTLEWAANILHDLGEPNYQDTWLREWADSNIKTKSFEEIQRVIDGIEGVPKQLIPLYEEELRSRRSDLSIHNVLLSYFSGQIYYKSDLKRLSEFSDENYFGWIADSNSEDVGFIIRKSLERLGENSPMGIIGKKIKKAIDTLALKSEINKLRARAFLRSVPKGFVEQKSGDNS